MLRVEAGLRPLSALAGAAADLLFPPECLLCQRSLLEERESVATVTGRRDFCRACLAELTTDLPRCARCGNASAVDGAAVCRDCQRAPPLWRGLVVCSAYGDLTRDAVLRAKRPAGEPIGMALGRHLGELVKTRLAGASLDAVVAVPMHWRRRALRGTSAAVVMAAAVAGTLGLPRLHCLRRTRATGMQNTLPPEQRPANVRGAFRARRSVCGKTVLLVDDVMTTGATMKACAQALLAVGAQDVYLAAVAKAERAALSVVETP